MNTRDIIDPIARFVPAIALPRQLSRTLFRSRRRSTSPALFIAAGVVLAGIAGAVVAPALLTPSRRDKLRDLLQRSGGGVGKQVGKFLGEHAGAHPQKTAELIEGARNLVGSHESPRA